MKLRRLMARYMPSETTLAGIVLAIMLLAAWRARGGMVTGPISNPLLPGSRVASPIKSVAVQVQNGFQPRMACVTVTTNGVVIGTPNYVATTSVPVMVMDDWECGWNCAPATKYFLTVTFNRALPSGTQTSLSVSF